MPSVSHEFLVELFRAAPELAGELLRSLPVYLAVLRARLGDTVELKVAASTGR